MKKYAMVAGRDGGAGGYKRSYKRAAALTPPRQITPISWHAFLHPSGRPDWPRPPKTNHGTMCHEWNAQLSATRTLGPPALHTHTQSHWHDDRIARQRRAHMECGPYGTFQPFAGCQPALVLPCSTRVRGRPTTRQPRGQASGDE